MITVNLTSIFLFKPFIRLNIIIYIIAEKQNKLQKYFQKWVYST